MSVDVWITGATLVGIVVLLVVNVAPAELVFVGGLAVLLALGVFDGNLPAAFSGFANPGTITIAALFVVAGGLQETGALESLTRIVFGRVRTVAGAQLRVMAPISFVSAFLNNTPVVAIFLPIVRDWAKRNGVSASRLLMPLSFAAIFGGLCTLIGTSTNLVVYGMMLDFTGTRIGFFDVTWVGLPCAILGIAYVVVVSRWLLPDRSTPAGTVEDPREYSVEMQVMPDASIVGLTIEEAGLRHLPGLYLAHIERDGSVLPAVSPHERLQAGDRLGFVGIVDSIADLQRLRGLVPAPEQVLKLDMPRTERVLVEAVVSNTSPLVSRTVRASRFRTLYSAAIISVHRSGERIASKIGDIVLEPGDNLLLEAAPEFVDQHRNSRAFFLVSPVAGSTPPRHERAPHALGILALLVLALVFGWFEPSVAALLAAGLMVLLGCLPANAALRDVDWTTILVIGAAFGIGKGLEVSGAAGLAAGALASMLDGVSPVWALLAIYVVTNVLTEVMTNVAAAALVFPFAVGTATALGVSPVPLAIGVMVAASAAFATPVGYQTNLMVWGPGAYRFTDFTRFGLPLNVLFAIGTIAIVPVIFPFRG